MKATEVFRPGAFPTHTYVQRIGAKLESALRDSLDTPGQLVSLVGPSKSGKTVLVERVVGADDLITITGAGIQSPSDIWQRTLNWMGEPDTLSETSTTGGKIAGSVGVSGSASAMGLATAKADGQLRTELGQQRAVTQTQGRRGLQQVVEEIADSDFVLLIDDFHYMHRDIQAEAAKQLKEAVRLGVKICTAAVRHRGDDLVRANPELRGRVRAVDIDYWDNDDLRKIATKGFEELGVELDETTATRLVQESAGSPQLMQLLCLNACFVANVRARLETRRTLKFSEGQLSDVFERASASTDFRSLADVLDAGPKTRGKERKMYHFRDGSTGDVYRCVLKAIASDPPRLSFKYDALLERCTQVVRGEPPVGSSVTGTCVHMARLAVEKFPNERALDWDETKDILDIPDPYLLFYLRWSGRLTEPD